MFKLQNSKCSRIVHNADIIKRNPELIVPSVMFGFAARVCAYGRVKSKPADKSFNRTQDNPANDVYKSNLRVCTGRERPSPCRTSVGEEVRAVARPILGMKYFSCSLECLEILTSVLEMKLNVTTTRVEISFVTFRISTLTHLKITSQNYISFPISSKLNARISKLLRRCE